MKKQEVLSGVIIGSMYLIIGLFIGHFVPYVNTQITVKKNILKGVTGEIR